MSFSTYAGLKAAVADWLDRVDLTGRIPDFITLATATLNKVLRDRRMVLNAGASTSARYLTAPTDMLEPLHINVTVNPDYPLEIVSPARLVELRRTRFLSPGAPRYFAVVGAWLELCPAPAESTTFDISYYAEIPPLVNDSDTNWVLTDEPDVYLYTALLHAANFLHDTEMAMRVRALLDVKIAAAVGVEQKNTEGGA